MTENPNANPLDWNRQLREQFTWHWENQARPRLGGLTDDEYFWEPASGAWSVRPRGQGRTEIQAGAGDMIVEFAFPPPQPPPITTIAWRLAHVNVGVLAVRNASHFGRQHTDYQTYEYAPTAAGALQQLDDEVAHWLHGVESLGVDGLDRPCGPAEGPFADAPMATLVLHIHRELIHHLAEIALLRDLYAHRER